MGTSINLRINDDLEKKLKEKVDEIKKITPVGAEVNNSTVVRGALVDFFDKIDKENKGEKSIPFNLTQMSDKELRKIEDTFDEILNGLDNILNEDEPGYWFVFDFLTFMSNQITYEILDRKRNKKISKEV